MSDIDIADRLVERGYAKLGAALLLYCCVCALFDLASGWRDSRREARRGGS